LQLLVWLLETVEDEHQSGHVKRLVIVLEEGNGGIAVLRIDTCGLGSYLLLVVEIWTIYERDFKHFNQTPFLWL
jgi:hypothetical protein